MKKLARVVTNAQIINTSALAHKIWNQHFVSIIGQAQVDYMLEKFQSDSAIQSQLDEGFQYFLLKNEEQLTGFLSIHLSKYPEELFISKIYVDAEARSSGNGQFMLDYVLKMAKDHGLNAVRLTVNRNNDLAVQWYLKRGFEVIEEAKFDIGNGYVMDDFVMVKDLR